MRYKNRYSRRQRRTRRRRGRMNVNSGELRYAAYFVVGFALVAVLFKAGVINPAFMRLFR